MPKADTDHTPTPSTDGDAPEHWPLGALEPAILDLRTALSLLGHLINSPDQVDKNTWQRVEDDLHDANAVIQQLWQQARDRGLAERREHEAALEAVRAEKAAPGQCGNEKRVAALWELLAAAAAVAMGQCAEAGYRLPGWRQETEERS